MPKSIEADIVIVGAGLVGLAAAVAFTLAGKQVVLVDAKKTVLYTPAHWDARIYAITPTNKTWLESLGVWAYVDESRVNQIHAMHLWQQGDEAKLVLSDEDAHLPDLGLIIENQNLLQALWQRLKALNIPVIEEVPWQHIRQMLSQITLQLADAREVSAKLLVAADGAHSAVRSYLNMGVQIKPFNQLALVANFVAEQPHGDTARQWFAPHETLALLPLPDKHVSMVWSLSTEPAQQLLKLNDQELTEAVQVRSHRVLGKLTMVDEVASFALQQIVPNQVIHERVILIGDAAHQVHPMAGQGVNLGFRDVMVLEKIFKTVHNSLDIGEKSLLRQYERARKSDVVSMNLLISGLDELFASDLGLLKSLRGWGLQQVNASRALKHLLIQQAVA
jgi:2-polyprenylphenol 6-hydroxylase